MDGKSILMLAFRLLGRLLVELDPEYLSEGSLYRDPFFLWKNSLVFCLD